MPLPIQPHLRKRLPLYLVYLPVGLLYIGTKDSFCMTEIFDHTKGSLLYDRLYHKVEGSARHLESCVSVGFSGIVNLSDLSTSQSNLFILHCVVGHFLSF